jgi:hypothetical protein
MQPFETMSKAAYAAHAGLSKGRVTQLTKPGQQLFKALTPNGQINVALADKLRGRSYDPGNGMAKRPPSSPPSDPDDDFTDDEDEDAVLLRKSRGRIAEADADFKAMRNREKAGELVDRAAFVARQTDRLKSLFDAIRGAKGGIVDRMMSEGLVDADRQIAARTLIAEELARVIEDWRKGIKDPLDA